MLHDDAGRLFIANNQPPLAFAKKVKGYVTHPTGLGVLQHGRAPVASGVRW